ncbi:MAG: hypothetical protein Q8K60_06735, partial [Parachlamydiaceae bacterium]|nr:hypothetical protein [Parachlamydiaceae bacterium]
MKKIYLFFFTFLILFSSFSTISATAKLYNYMGTGSNPRLQLQLSANGANQPTITIDYGAWGNVPWTLLNANNWSSWNVFDTNDPPNYYGTITLTSPGGGSVEWSSYSAGTQGYYLDGINLSYTGTGYNTYQLTVNSIVTPTGSSGQGTGPFPNTPLATPATYPGTTDPIVLSVVGDRIVTNHGQDVLLKGIVRPSLEWNP